MKMFTAIRDLLKCLITCNDRIKSQPANNGKNNTNLHLHNLNENDFKMNLCKTETHNEAGTKLLIKKSR